MNLTEKVKNTIAKYNLISKRDKILIAYSGGPDSTALLFVLKELGYNLHIAHLNHCLRAKESDDDEKFVIKVAKETGINWTVKRQKILKKARVSLEMRAREIRYKFLFKVATQVSATKIATAHTIDDNIETLLYRLFAGTSNQGLAGIPVIECWKGETVPVIRPLIETSKNEIIDYLHKNRINYRIDKSNYETRIKRNWIRCELLPKIEKEFKSVKKNLSNLIEIIKEENNFVDRAVNKYYKRLLQNSKTRSLELDLSKFKKLPVAIARRIINKILISLDQKPNYNYINNILYFILAGRRDKKLCNTKLKIELRDKKIIFNRDIKSGHFKKYKYKINIGENRLPELNITCNIKRGKVEKFEKGYLYFDYDKLKFPLILRNRRNGDKIWLQGMSGYKKIKEVFIDSKIQREEKEKIPLIVSNSKIIGILGGGTAVGNRIAEDVKVTSQTDKIVLLHYVWKR